MSVPLAFEQGETSIETCTLLVYDWQWAVRSEITAADDGSVQHMHIGACKKLRGVRSSRRLPTSFRFAQARAKQSEAA